MAELGLCPALRDVDLLAAKHGVDPGTQAAFRRQLQKELKSFLRDAMLRVIEVDAHRLGGHALAAFGILREEVPEMPLPDRPVVGFQGLPGWACSKWLDACCHDRLP